MGASSSLRTLGRRAAVLALLLGLVPPAAQAAGIVGARALSKGSAEASVSALSAALEQTGETAKLVFRLTRPVVATAFLLADPDRVIIDLPDVDFRLDPQTGKPPVARRGGAARPTGVVGSFRFGLLAPGKSRVVIDLAQPVRVVRVASEQDGDGTRLVVELAKTDRTSFKALVQSARTASAPSVEPPPATGPAPSRLPAPQTVIVIDPGHGGVDSGAMINGLVEKNLVFEFAKALAGKLEADGRFKVLLTRTDDVFVPLGDRVRMARTAGAELFLSIHADILAEGAEVAGATVYTVSDRASDAEAARVAEKENQSDALAGIEGQEDASGVSDILFDLTRRETRTFSHVFARTLINYWKVAGRLNKNPERSAGFRVLKAPDVPSVLLELGYLSNDRDSAALNTPEWRDKAAEQVATAIQGFFAGRGSSRPVAESDAEIKDAKLGALRGSMADVAGASQLPR